MKKNLIILTLLTAVLSARATLYSYDMSGGVIPDANITGISSSTNIDLGILPSDGTTAIINNVNVRLNITGGYNGDLYGYLVLNNGDGTFQSILLNRVGVTATDAFGSSASGFTVTLTGDSMLSSFNIHDVTPTSGGIYLADGRVANPATVTDATAVTAGLDVLNGKNANGTWTLFLADFSSGDTSTLVSWGLDISVVPEPITYALMIFGAVVMTVAVRRRLAVR